MYFRFVYPRARRIADMVASVPELTKRTFCMCGKAEMATSARSASAGVEAPKLVPLRIATQSLDNDGRGMAKNQRPPGADIVHILVAIGVPNVGTRPANHERRISANRAERAHRRIHPARNHFLGALLQPAGLFQLARHGTSSGRALNG